MSEKEDRSEYSYIFNHECGLYIGRVFGCGSFIVLAFCVSDNAALMVTLPIVTLLQAIYVLDCKNILKKIENEVDWQIDLLIEVKFIVNNMNTMNIKLFSLFCVMFLQTSIVYGRDTLFVSPSGNGDEYTRVSPGNIAKIGYRLASINKQCDHLVVYLLGEFMN